MNSIRKIETAYGADIEITGSDFLGKCDAVSRWDLDVFDLKEKGLFFQVKSTTILVSENGQHLDFKCKVIYTLERRERPTLKDFRTLLQSCPDKMNEVFRSVVFDTTTLRNNPIAIYITDEMDLDLSRQLESVCDHW